MNIQTCMAFYLVLNTKEDILKNVWVQTTLTVNSIDKKTQTFCVSQSHTGLVRH